MSNNISVVIPYNPTGNLGAEYNRHLQQCAEDDWICFLDHDAMWTTPSWFRQLTAAIQQQPGAGCFTCITNRVGNRIQVDGGFDVDTLPDDHDIRWHRKRGNELYNMHGNELQDISDQPWMSGTMILTSKRAWNQVKFTDGLLHVDNVFHQRLTEQGFRNFIIKGLYIYHWYRAVL